MPLSDTSIKNTKPAEKPCKLSDSGGLYLFVQPTGGKYFRMDYRFEGKRKTLALGTYPATGLAKARALRDTAKTQVADGIDPAAHKQATKKAKANSAANSFEIISREWLLKKCQDKSDRLLRLLGYLFPWLGKKPVKSY